MSTAKAKDEKEFDLEQQFILRMPEDAARYLAEDIDLGIPFRVHSCLSIPVFILYATFFYLDY